MMETSADIPLGNVRVKSMHPQKFALWLFIISATMIFAALTSAYVVKKAEGNWLLFDFPPMFNYTSIVIVLSSITMHFAYISSKRNNIRNIQIGLVLTAILAITFSIGQYLSWGELVAQNVYFVGNPAGSFIYVFTGLHIVHLLGGLIFIFIVLKRAFNFEIHSKSLVSIEMCTTYWHYLGGLWLYLYLFLILNN